jgi:hypothetical protein
MAYPPPGSVGSIHSHPSAFSNLQPPSGNDLQWAISNSKDIVIATSMSLYVIPAGGNNGYPIRIDFPDWIFKPLEQ